MSTKRFKIITQSIIPRDDGFNPTRSLTTLYTYLLHNMLKQQFYLKTLTTILVFSIVIGYFIFISTTYLRENVEDFSSIESNRLRRDAADTANDGGSIHTNKNPRKYIEKYQKTLDVHKVRRKRFTAGKRSTTCKTKKVEPDDNYWHELKSNLSNLTEEDIMKNNYLKKLKLSKNQLRALEKRTKRQYECHEWHVERKKRYVSLILFMISFYCFIYDNYTYWAFR